MSTRKIVLTGGGTAGHVTPNLALLPELKKNGYEILYIGSLNGIEKQLMEENGIRYCGIHTGKLRRYFDPQNFSDPIRVLKGLKEARKILREFNPDVVFSKGGYVAVPVVRAAHALHIPCIIHESDMTPGLANRLCFSSASRICCNFPETLKLLPQEKAVLTGTPIRAELFEGSRETGLALCGFTADKPVLMIMGGSQGAASVNSAVRENLDLLLKEYQIIHLCGKGKMDNLKLTIPGYKQFEYVGEELKHLYAACDFIISRSGANAICEILALQKPNILVPLPSRNSRGDQLLNAQSFEAQGYSLVADNDELPEILPELLAELSRKKEDMVQAMSHSSQNDAIPVILSLIEAAC